MDDAATLEVGFAIDFNDSFGQLRSLDDVVGDVAANVFREFQRVEQATKGAINMGSATAQVTAFGNAATREMREVARESAKVERAGEGVVRQMNRQIEVFGKNSSEIRQMRAEMRAVEAEGRGFTELAGRIRAASAELDRLEASGGRMGAGFNRNGHVMMNFGMQLNDVATMAALGAPPMQIFASQAGQVFQVVQMAEGGAAGFAKELGSVALRFAPVIGLAGAAAGAFALYSRAVSDVDTEQLIDGLGLTRDEIKKLENTSVTSGDVIAATFQVMSERVGFDLAAMRESFSATADFMTETSRDTLATMYATFSVGGRLDDIIVQGIMGGKGPGEIASLVQEHFSAARTAANNEMKKFGADVTDQIRSNKIADFRSQVAEMREGATASADRHAERLVREAEAIEAQIRNLHGLADAYRTSGAEALIAEARVAAESRAIKQQGDITAAVEREIRLAIAQRVSDAAKATAGQRELLEAQQRVNEMVAGGLVPAERAQQLVQDQIADLPLLAARQVAQEGGHAEAIAQTTRALQDQQQVREQLRKQDAQAGFNSAFAAGETRLDQLREELALIGATDAARARSLAESDARRQTAQWESAGWFDPAKAEEYIRQQGDAAELDYQRQLRADAFNESLRYQIDLFDTLARNVDIAGRNMGDAFGTAGQALGDLSGSFTAFIADQRALASIRDRELEKAGQITDAEQRIQREREIGALFAARTGQMQVRLYGDMAAAARGFFGENSDGYKAIAKAEQAFRAVEFALSVRAVAQDAIETASKLGNSAARSAAFGTEAVVRAIKELPWPVNLVAGAATAAAVASLGISLVGGLFGGGKGGWEPTNEGTGTVFGDGQAQSESIRRAIDQLHEVDTLLLGSSREMAASLRSIDSQIGGVAAQVVRAGGGNITTGVTEGFNPNLIGSVLGNIPLVGGFLSGLFGSKTSVIGSGIFGGPQTLAEILGTGFDASYYSDIEKKSKFLGITTGTKRSTQYTAASAALEDQFTLVLSGFNDALAAAAGPLGSSADEFQRRLNGFVIDIGKVDLKGLSGEEIEEKLSAVFGAAADRMAAAAFPGLQRFQQVGEGAFETAVRVASTVETVSASLDQLGTAAAGLGIDAQVGLAAQFDSLGDFTSATQGYLERFYTAQERAQAQAAQFEKVFAGLGLTMPASLAAFRDLVEAQNLTTAAGRETWATLVQLAPAFADLQSAMNGAKSAADILAERMDLQRQLLELQGDTAAIREMELAKLDESNRALQEQIWGLQDAQEAARAAEQLRDAWGSVGDSIMDEVRRIRGLSGAEQGGGFAQIMGQFNAMTTSARGGDLDAAKALPGLSQSLLAAAELAATSRQELDRVRAQTAASLEATYGSTLALSGNQPRTTEELLAAVGTVTAAGGQAANDSVVSELQALKADLRASVDQLRKETMAGLAPIAGNTGRTAKKLDDVTAASGGDAISVAGAA